MNLVHHGAVRWNGASEPVESPQQSKAAPRRAGPGRKRQTRRGPRVLLRAHEWCRESCVKRHHCVAKALREYLRHLKNPSPADTVVNQVQVSPPPKVANLEVRPDGPPTCPYALPAPPLVLRVPLRARPSRPQQLVRARF